MTSSTTSSHSRTCVNTQNGRTHDRPWTGRSCAIARRERIFITPNTSNRRTMNALVSSRSVSFKQYVYDVR